MYFSLEGTKLTETVPLKDTPANTHASAALHATLFTVSSTNFSRSLTDFELLHQQVLDLLASSRTVLSVGGGQEAGRVEQAVLERLLLLVEGGRVQVGDAAQRLLRHAAPAEQGNVGRGAPNE